jgi:hypothetical protein
MFNPQQTIQHIFKQLSLASQSRNWSKESRISEREKQYFLNRFSAFAIILKGLEAIVRNGAHSRTNLQPWGLIPWR